MKRGEKYINKDVVYVSLTKHYCPNCSENLKTVKVSKVINYHSPEAENFDFTFGSGNHIMVVNDDVKFTWKEFECPKCKKHFTVEELKTIEGLEPDILSDDKKQVGKRNSIKNLIILFMIYIVGAIIFSLIRDLF